MLKQGSLSSKKGIIMFIQFTQTMQTLNINKQKSSIKIIELWISVNNTVWDSKAKKIYLFQPIGLFGTNSRYKEIDHINNCKTHNHINNLKTSHTKGNNKKIAQ